jgi:hypothetical protein
VVLFICTYFVGPALKSPKWRFSSQNYKNVEFLVLVSKSPTHTGLICVKTLEPNISSLDPFNEGGLARLMGSGFKKGGVLLYYSSSEFWSFLF